MQPVQPDHAGRQPPLSESPMFRSYPVVAISYLAAYVLLDRISYVHPYAEYGITPWNPQAGLSFVLIILFGPRFLPLLFIAPLLADYIVRDVQLPLAAQVAFVLATAAGYGGASLLLVSPRLKFDSALRTKRAVFLLLAVAALSAAAVALAHGAILLQAGIITGAYNLLQVVLRAFIGDLIGIMIFTPFLLIGFRRGFFPGISWEIGAISLLMVASLWLVFGFSQSFQFQLFYLFFLPIVWIAMRFGMRGATGGLVVIQVGLIMAIQWSGQTAGNVVAFQALMAVLALTGIAIGMLIDEQLRTQQQLRLHQEALNRAGRVGVIGEFAAAVAHEINQPLTAIANFMKIAKRAAEQTPPDAKSAAAASAEGITQVDRAGAVVRRLRDFIRGGHIETSTVQVTALVGDALAAARAEMDRHGIVCEIRVDRDMPAIEADVIQIQQVLLNLLRNAIEALADAGRYDGRIVITARRESPEAVTFRIEDNGPGLDPDLVDQPITSFTTTKPGGLGLGLSLSRSIIEGHGGTLRLENSASGACAVFTLPVEQPKRATA